MGIEKESIKPNKYHELKQDMRTWNIFNKEIQKLNVSDETLRVIYEEK